MLAVLKSIKTILEEIRNDARTDAKNDDDNDNGGGSKEVEFKSKWCKRKKVVMLKNLGTRRVAN